MHLSKLCLIPMTALAISYNCWAAEPLFPYSLESKTLDNGLTIHVVPMDSPNLASYYTWMKVGSRDETTPGRTGFAHFFEHLMFYGTPTMGRTQREQTLVNMGASENAWTWFDETVYHATLTTNHLDTYIAMEADRFQRLHLEVNDVKKEAGAVYGEFRKGRSDPFEQLTDTLFALAFPTHTYGHSTLGYENDIRAMPNALEHSKIFFNEYYRPENAIILVVGDVNSESVFATIEQHYRSWEPYTGPASPITEEPPQTETRRKHIDWEPSTAPLMTMAWRIPGHTEDSAALQVAADLLGSETNRLYERLIREEEIAYDIDVRRMSLVDPCLFLINVELKTTTAFNRAEQIIREEITSLVTSVDLDLLTRTKAKQKYGLLSSLDTPSAVANVLGWELRRTGSLENFEKYLNNYQMVDHKHIQQALTNYLIDPNLTMVTLGHTQASEEQP